MRKKHPLSIHLLFLLLFQCCSHAPRDVSMAFYHWKTTINEADFNIHTSKIYLRLFDVDWDESAKFPKYLADLAAPPIHFTQNKKIVPVIFLTNKTFAQLPEYQLDTLAQLVSQKIKKTMNGQAFEEVQFDCDWTVTTRIAYFSFLTKIKKLFSDKKISTTIRLHQVKFREKTGVPPVERGMLMAYNMGNLDDIKTDNSILNIETLKSYFKNFEKYPLPLDVALPIFSWGIVFRDGEAVRIINNISPNDFSQPLLFEQNGPNRITLLKNQYLKGFYLYENDEIRIEEVPLSNLLVAANYLSNNIKNQEMTVAFYHLDSVTLQKYRYEDLENITQQFR